jgi:hypothetical protein
MAKNVPPFPCYKRKEVVLHSDTTIDAEPLPSAQDSLRIFTTTMPRVNQPLCSSHKGLRVSRLVIPVVEVLDPFHLSKPEMRNAKYLATSSSASVSCFMTLGILE